MDPTAPPASPSPVDVARAALRSLAQRRLEPTPENYARAWAEQAGSARLTPAPPAARSLPRRLRNMFPDTPPRPARLGALVRRLAAERDPLFEIDCALQRIHDGTYGFCETTGHPIAPRRLREAPWERYCRTVSASMAEPSPTPPPSPPGPPELPGQR